MNTRLLHALCAVPTAPFAEQRVIEFVLAGMIQYAAEPFQALPTFDAVPFL